MGLEFVRTLSARDLSDMAGNGLPRDIHRSFRNSDLNLVIEATDGTNTRYIAMEISFTAGRRDCDRAIRNAGLITRFTGKPAKAAVASVRNDRDAADREPTAAARGRTGPRNSESGSRNPRRGLVVVELQTVNKTRRGNDRATGR